jgi:hypothetical protein
MRYEVLVKKGRKIIERHQREDYNDAMMILEMIEETMGYTYTVEFKDKFPFGRR